MLPDGRRLHLHDGPIDLIVEANGSTSNIRAAYDAASRRFSTILSELCAELPSLRRPAAPNASPLSGPIARRMSDAIAPYATELFITPMAAVAGAVAENILETMSSAATFDRAYVNNGGDIAFHLAPGWSYTIGMIERPDRPSLFGSFTISSTTNVRGVATSGWRGRSFSLGIADAVTVLAARSADADAAATVIANAVNLPHHPSIIRVPAREVAPDSDLGDLLVTRNVGPLNESDRREALFAGVKVAQSLLARGLISACALSLEGQTRVVSESRTELSLDLSAGRLVHA
jgi:hypothetical protein